MTNTQQQTLDVLKELHGKGMKFEYWYKDNPTTQDEINYKNNVFAYKETEYIYRIPTVPQIEELIDKMADYWVFKKSSGIPFYKYSALAWDVPDGNAYKNSRAYTGFNLPYTEPKRLLASLQLLNKLADDNEDKWKEINNGD